MIQARLWHTGFMTSKHRKGPFCCSSGNWDGWTTCSKRATSSNITLVFGIAFRMSLNVRSESCNFFHWAIRMGCIECTDEVWCYLSWTFSLGKLTSWLYISSLLGIGISITDNSVGCRRSFSEAAATESPVSCWNLWWSSPATVSNASKYSWQSSALG